MNIQVDYIPGIYNYCDTWCERCRFTARCRSFQIQSETGLAKSMEPSDKLVQQLTEALALTKQYIEKLSRVNQPLTGTDAPTDDQARQLEENAVRPVDTRRHPIVRLANEYLRQTGVWLKDEQTLLEQVGQQQLREVELGLRTQKKVMPVLDSLKDAWEMIRWYRTLIPVKAQSALRALNEPNAYLNTYHLGKAKLVLVSIDQSLLAWQTIVEQYPEKIDDLLDLLVLLNQLRREIETQFPDARAFKRPGLD